MNQSQYARPLVLAGLCGANDRELGGVSGGPEYYVLSFLTEIAYPLIPQELAPNPQYLRNSFA